MDPRTANSTWHTQFKRAREGAGLTQQDLARRVRLPQAHISRIERGLVDPRLSTAMELAKALGSVPMLIPRRALPAVLAVLRDFDGASPRGSQSAVQLLVADDRDDPDG